MPVLLNKNWIDENLIPFPGSDESGDENYGMGGYGTIQDAKERSQDRRKNLDAMKYDKKSSALSELKAKRQERERRDMERAKKEKEKSKGGKINMLN